MACKNARTCIKTYRLFRNKKSCLLILLPSALRSCYCSNHIRIVMYQSWGFMIVFEAVSLMVEWTGVQTGGGLLGWNSPSLRLSSKWEELISWANCGRSWAILFWATQATWTRIAWLPGGKSYVVEWLILQVTMMRRESVCPFMWHEGWVNMRAKIVSFY